MRRRLARAFLVPFVVVAMAIDGTLFEIDYAPDPQDQ